MVPAWEEKRSGSSRKAIIKKGAELRQRQRFSYGREWGNNRFQTLFPVASCAKQETSKTWRKVRMVREFEVWPTVLSFYAYLCLVHDLSSIFWFLKIQQRMEFMSTDIELWSNWNIQQQSQIRHPSSPSHHFSQSLPPLKREWEANLYQSPSFLPRARKLKSPDR